MTLFKTDIGTVCGGFASVSWKSSGGSCEDSNAFLFSLDWQLVFPVKVASLALHFSTETGPFFGKYGDRVDLGKYESISYVSHSTNRDIYKVGTDSNGNSLLTGTSGDFTAVEIETFKLTW